MGGAGKNATKYMRFIGITFLTYAKTFALEGHSQTTLTILTTYLPSVDVCNGIPLLLGGVHKLRLQNLAFFDHLPPSVYIFYGMKVYKKSIFLTTYPPPLVNVVCERPLL